MTSAASTSSPRARSTTASPPPRTPPAPSTCWPTTPTRTATPSRVTGKTNGAHGTVSCTGPGVCTYTPAADYNGPDSFTYTVSDGNGGTATGTVNVTVTPVNDAPVAVADSATTAEDTAKAIDVLANDSDVDGPALTASLVTGAAHGTVSCVAATCTYTPAANYNGPDSFTYKASDGSLQSTSVTVSITVTPVNDAPDAVNDAASAGAGVATPVSVLGNDTDVDGDTLTVTGKTDGAHGTVTCTTTTCTYTSAAGYSGPDSFTYTISDGHGGTDTATVTMTVTAGNRPPVATDDSFSTPEDTPQGINVLANDTDPDSGHHPDRHRQDQRRARHRELRARRLVHLHAGRQLQRPRLVHLHRQRRLPAPTPAPSRSRSPRSTTPRWPSRTATTTAEDTAKVIPVTANDTDVDGADPGSRPGHRRRTRHGHLHRGQLHLHARRQLQRPRLVHLPGLRRVAPVERRDRQHHGHRGQRRPARGHRRAHHRGGHRRERQRARQRHRRRRAEPQRHRQDERCARHRGLHRTRRVHLHPGRQLQRPRLVHLHRQ